MEDEGNTKAQVEPCEEEEEEEDLVENQSHSLVNLDHAKGKCPCEEDQSSASAAAAAATSSSVDQVKGKRPCEDDQSSASETAAVATVDQVKGKRPCEDDQSSASETAAAADTVDQVKGKRPCEDDQSSASETAAAAATGTKNIGEGAKRPCVETRMPSYNVMDETEEEEEEGIDYGEDWLLDGGYDIHIEGDQVIVIGERPKPVIRSLGRPPPNALTAKRMARRLRETGLGHLRADDPIGKIPWNPFPFPVQAYPSQTPLAASASGTLLVGNRSRKPTPK